MPICRHFSYGETRTRTGDSTIFRDTPTGLEILERPCKSPSRCSSTSRRDSRGLLELAPASGRGEPPTSFSRGEPATTRVGLQTEVPTADLALSLKVPRTYRAVGVHRRLDRGVVRAFDAFRRPGPIGERGAEPHPHSLHPIRSHGCRLARGTPSPERRRVDPADTGRVDSIKGWGSALLFGFGVDFEVVVARGVEFGVVGVVDFDCEGVGACFGGGAGDQVAGGFQAWG
jgi:hypothetical protein